MRQPTSVTNGVIILVAILIGVLGLQPSADAHTEFELSDPVDGAIVDEPISEVRVRFTAASIIAGDGFVVLTPSGDQLSPPVTVSEDEREFLLTFDPPLTAGTVGVRWSVRAGDAHPIEGSFSFTTTAAPPLVDLTSPDPEDAELPPASIDGAQPPALESEAAERAEPTAAEDEVKSETVVASLQPVVGSAEADLSEADDTEPTETSTASSTTEIDAPTAAPVVEGGSGAALEDFLAVESDRGADSYLGYVGRLVSVVGALLLIGVVAFHVLVAQDGDGRYLVAILRRFGLAVVLGAAIETLAFGIGEQSGEVLVGTQGLALALRAGGAGLLLVSTRSMAIDRVRGTQNDPVLVASSGAVFAGDPTDSGPTDSGPTGERLPPVALALAAAVAASYLFDGHTVTEGNRLLTSLVDFVHVVGGGVWLGGLASLYVLFRTPSRRDPEAWPGAVLRFSSVATIALVAVGVAGLALSVTILDSPSELWSTPWGRLLVAKSAIVSLAAAAGAFNHRVLVPELRTRPTQEALQATARSVRLELIAMLVAVAITAALVAAAS